MSNIEHAVHRAAREDLERLSEQRQRSYRMESAEDPKNCGWMHETTYEFKDGETVTLEAHAVNCIVFPASPGFEHVTFERWHDAEPETFNIAANLRRAPIIGWEIRDNSEGIPEPISTDSDNYQAGCYNAIVLPDGHIEGRLPAWKAYESIDGWIESVRADWRHRLDEAAKREEARKSCPTCGLTRDGFDDSDIPF